MKILCPTDLSDHSKIAIEYAINLANDLRASIHIISVLEVPQQLSSIQTMDKILVESRKKELDNFVTAISPLIKTDIPPVVLALPGFTVEQIIKYTESEGIDLIVMGTQGRNSIRSLLFGSVTREVAEHTAVPLLAIPQDIKHELGSNKIILALDGKILDNSETFEVPKILAKRLRLKIDVLHIDDKPSEDLPIDPFISEYLGDALGEVIMHEGKDAVTEIKRYAEDHNIGMIMMIRRKKGFFSKLFFIGNTSEELARTNIPLMILPD